MTPLIIIKCVVTLSIFTIIVQLATMQNIAGDIASLVLAGIYTMVVDVQVTRSINKKPDK